ncbi:MAG: hypothetical protein HQK86_14970 [Nitrospinae bacterium]|nr:hypothetical protein [Nitrospinota bacterium]MBF0633503.1 hypothetical protein [Nitrospinota bacterium]
MRRACFAATLFLAFIVGLSAEAYADNVANLNLLYTQKNMEKWQNELKELPAYGIEGDIRLGSAPINLWMGVTTGKDTGKTLSRGLTVTVDTTQTEMYIGARSYLQFGSTLATYAGLGVSSVKSDVSGKSGGVSSSNSETTTGYLWNFGILLRFGNFNIGGDYRALSGTSLNMENAYSNVNYNQMGVVLGFNW